MTTNRVDAYRGVLLDLPAGFYVEYQGSTFGPHPLNLIREGLDAGRIQRHQVVHSNGEGPLSIDRALGLIDRATIIERTKRQADAARARRKADREGVIGG